MGARIDDFAADGRLGCGDYLEVLADELRAGVEYGRWGIR